MASAQLSPAQRSKWLYVTIGLTLILLSLALAVGWQYLGSPGLREGARFALHVTGSLLALALTGGLVLIFVLLLREVRLNERQSNFVSAVTHELKTPVASLRLYLDTLEMRSLPEERRAEFYRTMRQDLDRLNTTINNVLHAAMYTDRPVLDPQPLDFARLVRRAVELTRRRHQLDAGAVRFAGPETLTLRGDAGGLETAVLNLLDNAVKYSPAGGVVHVELQRREDEARIVVRDAGRGMDADELQHAFTPFWRGSDNATGGSGLGLHLVRELVLAHGGAVSVHSDGRGRGCEIAVRLPLGRTE